MRRSYVPHRTTEPAKAAQAPADTVADCPPHYWIVDARAQQCRKCGAQRAIGRDGRVVAPPVVEEVAAVEAVQ